MEYPVDSGSGVQLTSIVAVLVWAPGSCDVLRTSVGSCGPPPTRAKTTTAPVTATAMTSAAATSRNARRDGVQRAGGACKGRSETRAQAASWTPGGTATGA